jgi:hypothetical protein
MGLVKALSDTGDLYYVLTTWSGSDLLAAVGPTIVEMQFVSDTSADRKSGQIYHERPVSPLQSHKSSIHVKVESAEFLLPCPLENFSQAQPQFR